MRNQPDYPHWLLQELEMQLSQLLRFVAPDEYALQYCETQF